MSTQNTENTPNLADILKKPIRVTGNEIPDGTYPATLAKYSKPFWQDQTKSKFYKQGDPEKQLMIRAEFGITLKNGALEGVGLMLPVPSGEAHRKSNVYKFMKALAAGNPELIDKDGNFSETMSLEAIIGKNATLSIKTNAKGFPQVETVQAPIDGLKYPTMEEVAKLSFDGDGGDAPF